MIIYNYGYVTSLCLSFSLSVCVTCILKAMINRRLASVRVFVCRLCTRLWYVYAFFVLAFSLTHTHYQSETLRSCVRPSVHSFIHSLFPASTRALPSPLLYPVTSPGALWSAVSGSVAPLRDRISVFTRSSRLSPTLVCGDRKFRSAVTPAFQKLIRGLPMA